MGFHWNRDHLYLAEPLDHLEHRIREQQDPYPGVSSLDEARRERQDDFEPAPRRAFPLRLARPAAPSSVGGGQVPTAPASRRGETAASGPRDCHDLRGAGIASEPRTATPGPTKGSHCLSAAPAPRENFDDLPPAA